MTQLHRSAAYIRRPATEAVLAANRSDMEQRVLALLESAHTVESLSRRLSKEKGDKEKDVDAQDVQREVTAAMRYLLEQNLIELSPDS